MSLEINRIYYNDCIQILPYIDNESINMILCDLPYNQTKHNWDKLIAIEELWRQYIRIIKPSGVIVLTATQPFTSKIILSKLDWFKYCWVWEKNCPSNIACGNYQPLKYTEDIVVFYKTLGTFNKQLIPRSSSGSKIIKQHQQHNTTFKLIASKTSSSTSTEIDPNRYNIDFKNPSNLIFFGVERGKKHIHPSQKPLGLFEYLIKTYTNENDLVLDNCAGSMTTAVSCDNLNRKWICIEKEQKYCEKGLLRINNNRINLSLMPTKIIRI
jgi:site-specific DNA-methyltransferase (adenine-specific)